MPLAPHVLPCDRIGEALGGAQLLHQSRHLGHRGDVADEDAAGHQGVRDGSDVLPGGEHIEHDPVDACGFQARKDRVDIADAKIPGRMTTPEPQVHVGRRDVGEVLTPFD